MSHYDYREGVRVQSYSNFCHALDAMQHLPFNWDAHFATALTKDTALAAVKVLTKLRPLLETEHSFIELRLGRSGDLLINVTIPGLTYQIFIVDPTELHLYTYKTEITDEIEPIKTPAPSSFGWKTYKGSQQSEKTSSQAVISIIDAVFA